MIHQLHFPQKEATLIKEDNQSCVAIDKYPKINNRRQHINIMFLHQGHIQKQGDSNFYQGHDSRPDNQTPRRTSLSQIPSLLELQDATEQK
jgi:hypothetical protein